MLSDRFADWQRAYRRAGEDNQNIILQEHLGHLGIDAGPELLLEGTVRVVAMSLAYLQIDNRPIEKFLAMQAYNPPLKRDVPYIFTFDMWGQLCARLFVGPGENKLIDLADLLGSPWADYELAGYSGFTISRADRKRFSAREVNRLIRFVKDDLYYDYTQDELEIDFNDYNNRSCLQVTVTEQP